MTPVEELRSAAVLLRQRATAAPKGPWTVEYFGDRGYPQRVTNAQATLIATTHEAGIGLRPIPEYIRMMHPLVGLALADLLDVLSWFPSQADPTDLTAAGRLARLILGEPVPDDGFRPVEMLHLPVLGGEPA